MLTLAVVGAGLRSMLYAQHAVESGRARIVAVAEPDTERRESFAARYGVADEMMFADWADMMAAGQLADAIIIGTQDRMHTEPAIAAANLGYHILLEKPMAPTEDEATAIVAAAQRAGVMLAVCHVLRYTHYVRTLKRLLNEGAVGQIINIQHLEQVGWWHHAHSFVRGNWRSSDEATPFLLAKACHDIDIIAHLKGGVPTKVSSMGDLTHFRPDARPVGATERCLDCPVEPTCPYSASRLYLGCLGDPNKEFWPLAAVTTDVTAEGVTRALREGPYGRCVYAGGNDALDTQVVMMQFADGATATCTVTAFAPLEHRKTRIFGTRGSIEGDGTTIAVHDFVTDEVTRIEAGTGEGASLTDGHGGGDKELMLAFLDALIESEPGRILTDGEESLATHRVVWAAERARLGGDVVPLIGLVPDRKVATP